MIGSGEVISHVSRTTQPELGIILIQTSGNTSICGLMMTRANAKISSELVITFNEDICRNFKVENTVRIRQHLGSRYQSNYGPGNISICGLLTTRADAEISLELVITINLSKTLSELGIISIQTSVQIC